MSVPEFYDAVKALIEQGECGRAASALAALPAARLTRAQTAEAFDCAGRLPRGEAKALPGLCFLAARAGWQLGEGKAARRWQSDLAAAREACPREAPERPMLDWMVNAAGLCLPGTDNANLLLLLSILYNQFPQGRPGEPCLSATGRLPSVLRGAKDLSEWGRNYHAVRSIVRPMLGAVLADEGRGVCEAAVAELCYERGENTAASLEAAGAIAAGEPEVAFAGLALLARIDCFDPDSRPAGEILERIGLLIEERGADALRENYGALRARFALLEGDVEAANAWAEGCGLGDLDGCRPADAYLLMTKAKVYLAAGRPRDAATLFEAVQLSLQGDFRPLDRMECLGGGAVACAMLGSGELGLDKLEEALRIGQPYGYLRVLGDYGAPMARLLGQCAASRPARNTAAARYRMAVLAAAEEAAARFPKLFYSARDQARDGGAPEPPKEGLTEALTQTERAILQMVAEGRSNNDICSRLHIKLSTVKFHMTNLMGKLGAPNRTAAVSIARKNRLID